MVGSSVPGYESKGTGGWVAGHLKQVISMPGAELHPLSWILPGRGSAAFTSGL